MRLIADENVPASAVSALGAAGHDVKWIRKDAPGIRDDEVLALAARERRTLVTFDKDFGELAWRYPLPRDCGIILFRLPMASPSEVARHCRCNRFSSRLGGPLLGRRAKSRSDASVARANRRMNRLSAIEDGCHEQKETKETDV